MLDPIKQQQIEQSVAAMVEMWPPVWKGLYDRCIKQGFNEAQAMELVKAFIVGQAAGKIVP